MKDSVVTARINSKLKKEAESILKKEGLSNSKAIGLFYSKIVDNKGLPFKLKLDLVPLIDAKEQQDIEKILKKRTKKDKEIVRVEYYTIEL